MPDWLNRIGNPIMTWLLRSPLHGLVSRRFLLLTFTGRKSGARYTTPVAYVEDGGVLWITSRRRRRWWRNLSGGAPVTIRLRGRDLAAQGELIADDPQAVANALFAYLAARPRYAPAFQVGLGPGGRPNRVDVERSAADRVMIRLRLPAG